MNLLREISAHLRSLWRRREVKHETDEELGFHTEVRMAENIAADRSPEHEAREARKRFGNMLSSRRSAARRAARALAKRRYRTFASVRECCARIRASPS
jgi:hypothetical protein